MVDPIFSSPGLSGKESHEPILSNITVSCFQVQQGIDQFIEVLRNLQQEPSLAKNPQFINKVHGHLLSLKAHVEEALKVKE